MRWVYLKSGEFEKKRTKVSLTTLDILSQLQVSFVANWMDHATQQKKLSESPISVKKQVKHVRDKLLTFWWHSLPQEYWQIRTWFNLQSIGNSMFLRSGRTPKEFNLDAHNAHIPKTKRSKRWKVYCLQLLSNSRSKMKLHSILCSVEGLCYCCCKKGDRSPFCRHKNINYYPINSATWTKQLPPKNWALHNQKATLKDHGILHECIQNVFWIYTNARFKVSTSSWDQELSPLVTELQEKFNIRVNGAKLSTTIGFCSSRFELSFTVHLLLPYPASWSRFLPWSAWYQRYKGSL